MQESGFSYDMVRRVVENYWTNVIRAWEDGEVTKLPYRDITMELVYAPALKLKPHEFHTRRLRVEIETPKGIDRGYRMKANRWLYGKWWNMKKRGHKFTRK